MFVLVRLLAPGFVAVVVRVLVAVLVGVALFYLPVLVPVHVLARMLVGMAMGVPVLVRVVWALILHRRLLPQLPWRWPGRGIPRHQAQ